MKKEETDLLRQVGVFTPSDKVISILEKFENNIIDEVKSNSVIVTGANSGIGKGIATAFARLGCHVVLACRNIEKGKAAIEDILSKNKNVKRSHLCLLKMDLSNLTSVASFTEKVREKVSNKEIPPIRVLVFNAGILPFNYTKTEQGLEPNFGVNHLGHFFLFRSILKDPSTVTPELRVVSMASHGHYSAMSDIDFTNRKDLIVKLAHASEKDLSSTFAVWGSYGNGKLCNVLFARYLTGKTFNGIKVTAGSCNPGVVYTNVGHESTFVRWLKPIFGPLFMQNIDQGGTSAITIALLPNRVVQEKLYLGSDCNPCIPSGKAIGEAGKEAEDQLWTISNDLCDLFVAGKPIHQISNL